MLNGSKNAVAVPNEYEECVVPTRSNRERRPIQSRTTTEKSIVSVRMPAELVAFVEEEARARAAALGLKGEAVEAAVNMTATINRTLEAFRTWFGLPSIVAEAIERDRAALGLGRLEYLQYLVFRRYEALVKHGPGFDKATLGREK
jgi:hypothetical protein